MKILHVNRTETSSPDKDVTHGMDRGRREGGGSGCVGGRRALEGVGPHQG